MADPAENLQDRSIDEAAQPEESHEEAPVARRVPPPDDGPAPASAAPADDEARFVVLINELRAERGVAALEVHPQLVGPSREWSAHMAITDLAHAPDLAVGVSVEWTKLGENVGVGPQGQVQQIFDAFVASPSHLDNLLDPAFRHVGIGVVYDERGQLWTTHRFMAVAAGASATSTPPPVPPATTVPARSTATPPPAPVPTTTDTATTPPDAPAQLAFIDPGPLSAPMVAGVIASLAGSGV